MATSGYSKQGGASSRSSGGGGGAEPRLTASAARELALGGSLSTGAFMNSTDQNTSLRDSSAPMRARRAERLTRNALNRARARVVGVST